MRTHQARDRQSGGVQSSYSLMSPVGLDPWSTWGQGSGGWGACRSCVCTRCRFLQGKLGKGPGGGPSREHRHCTPHTGPRASCFPGASCSPGLRHVVKTPYNRSFCGFRDKSSRQGIPSAERAWGRTCVLSVCPGRAWRGVAMSRPLSPPSSRSSPVWQA